MKNYHLQHTFAATYGSGNYNDDVYGSSTQTSTGTGSNGGSTGVLANTGFEILVAVTLACLIIFVALMVRYWRRKPTKFTAAK